MRWIPSSAAASPPRARAVWEAVNNRWNQWVLNYTQSQQLDLLKALGIASPDAQDLARVLGALAAAAALAGVGWNLWERRRQDPWLRLLERARRRLARAGLPLPGHLPPRAMAQQARDRFGGVRRTGRQLAAAHGPGALRSPLRCHAGGPATGAARPALALVRPPSAQH